MSIESHVTSLELSNRLKELGVSQESYAHWVKLPSCDPFLTIHREDPIGDEYTSAFLASELGEMLPEACLLEGTTQVVLHCSKYSGGWRVSYQSNKFRGKRAVNVAQHGNTEADARAKLLIHLIEKGIINPNS